MNTKNLTRWGVALAMVVTAIAVSFSSPLMEKKNLTKFHISKGFETVRTEPRSVNSPDDYVQLLQKSERGDKWNEVDPKVFFAYETSGTHNISQKNDSVITQYFSSRYHSPELERLGIRATTKVESKCEKLAMVGLWSARGHADNCLIDAKELTLTSVQYYHKNFWGQTGVVIVGLIISLFIWLISSVLISASKWWGGNKLTQRIAHYLFIDCNSSKG